MQFYNGDVPIYSKSCGDPPLGCSDVLGVGGNGSGTVGKTLTIWASDCFNLDPSTGYVDLTGGWDDPNNPLTCGLADIGPALPSGGVCKPNYSGIKNCYTLYNSSTNKCTSYCPGSTRTADSGCTKFLDQFPVVQVSTTGPCS
jgi:hypothetical protein